MFKKKLIIIISFITLLTCLLPTQNKEKQNLLRLSFSGDLMAHKINYKKKPYSRIYKNIEHILKSNDLNFCNLEFPIVNLIPMSTYPKFNVHTDYVTAAIDAGYNAFSLANNHTLDQGVKGTNATLKVMDNIKLKKEIYFSGIKTNKKDKLLPRLIVKENYRIGFLAISEISNLYKGIENIHLVNYKNQKIKKKFIEYLKSISSKYDVFILSVHGGVEYETEPINYKKEFFYECIKAGVDIIWGHHPHVLQKYELIEFNRQKKIIMYSTGNLNSGYIISQDPFKYKNDSARTSESAIFIITIKNSDNNMDLTCKPIGLFNYYSPLNGISIYAMDLLLDAKTIIPPTWRNYYSNRKIEMLKILSPEYNKILN